MIINDEDKHKDEKHLSLDGKFSYIKDTWSFDESQELRIWLGLTGELGEMAEKTKKLIRNQGDVQAWRKDIKYEVGDLLYYLAMFCSFYDLSLDEIVYLNRTKLRDRKERDVIKAEGDYR